jgi:hypothetical protein
LSSIEKCPIADYTSSRGSRAIPKVESFEISGLSCWFWSNDHDPPHFHVKKHGEWEIKVKFTESEGKTHRAALLAEWEAKVNR